MYSSTVIDAMYINKHYPIKGLIGKGKDPILGCASTIYLVQELVADDQQTDDGSGQYFTLQVYQSLAKDAYDTKVKQLQQMMTERYSDYNARVMLLGKQKLGRGCSDLYVLYEYTLAWTPLLKETFDEKKAKNLLAHLALNLCLSARFTNEFLDISPHNISVNNGDGNKENYQKYIINNFGLTMGKFDRQYIPSTDPFNKQKSLTNIINSYAFKAGLVVLQVITQLDPRLFFFEDGQFKDKFATQVLKLLVKPREGEEEIADQLVVAFLKANHLPVKEEQVIKAVYSKDFIGTLQKLLSNDPSKRSFFQLLVSSPENYLEIANPVCNGFQADKTPYFGQGKLNEDKTITPNGVGQGVIQVNGSPQNYYGLYAKDGKPKKIGCTEIKEDGFLQLYVFDDGNRIIEFKKQQITNKSKRYQPAAHVYYGQFNPKNYFPHGQGRMIMIQPDDINLPNKYVAYYYEGIFDQGLKVNGIEYYKNRNHFDGTFVDEMPEEGEMTYGEKDHKFTGRFANYERLAGELELGKQTFEGTFVKDQISEGSLSYADGGLFTGQFKNGQRLHGTYQFPLGKITYNGEFKNDKMDGKGFMKVADDQKSADDAEQIEVVYEKGLCKTVLPETYQTAFKQMYEEIKKSKQPQVVVKKTADKQQSEQGEEIEEVIEQNVGDDVDDEKHSMNDEDEQGQDDEEQIEEG